MQDGPELVASSVCMHIYMYNQKIQQALVIQFIIYNSSIQKKVYRYFLAHEVIIMWMCISKLERCGPGGDCVLCISKDVITRHIRFRGLVFTMTS